MKDQVYSTDAINIDNTAAPTDSPAAFTSTTTISIAIGLLLLALIIRIFLLI